MSRPATGARQRGPLPRPTLLSTEPVTRARTFEQLFVHASGLSPAFGQAGYFRKMAPVGSSEHAIGRFGNEAQRQLGLLDRCSQTVNSLREMIIPSQTLPTSDESGGEHFPSWN
jgi:glutathione S-transferase